MRVLQAFFVFVIFGLLCQAASQSGTERKQKPITHTGTSPNDKKTEELHLQKEKLIQHWRSNKQQKDMYDKSFQQTLQKVQETEEQFLSQGNVHHIFEKACKLIDQGDSDGIEYLIQAADAGHRKALYKLGRQFEYGDLIPRDMHKAVKYYKRAAEFGDPEAQRAYAFMLEMGRHVPKNIPKAILYYTFAANNYDIEASLVLGNKHQRGYDTPKSCSSALTYYKYAASQVIAEIEKTPYIHSQHFQFVSLPHLGKSSDGISHEEYLTYIKFNANPENPSSLIEVGMLYLFGHYGHEVDYQIAKDYFEQVDYHEEPKAAAMLGRMYEFGLGVERDPTKAKNLYTIAVNKKNIQGIVYFGEMCMTGNGIEKDYQTAYQLFLQGSQMRAPEAFLNLGIMHFEGWGVEQDFEKAANYFKNVLTGGFSTTTCRAEYYYAEMLHYGIGTHSECQTAVLRYKSVTDKGKWMHDMKRAATAYEEDDIDSALLIYEKLAEIGVGLAQANAAWIYDEFGDEQTIVPSHDSLSFAIKYYTRAAEQGNEHAHLRLGDFYYFGVGNITMDHSKAASYYRHISNQHPQAHYNLGYMHQYGDGVKKDIYLAKRYFDGTLEMQPEAFIPIYIGLFNIGLEYSYQLYAEGKTDQLIFEAVDYFTPDVFYEFYARIMEVYFIETQTGKTTATTTKKVESTSFLDRESIFGYNWDTIIIFTLLTILTVTLLFRFGIIQIQVI